MAIAACSVSLRWLPSSRSSFSAVSDRAQGLPSSQAIAGWPTTPLVKVQAAHSSAPGAGPLPGCALGTTFQPRQASSATLWRHKRWA